MSMKADHGEIDSEFLAVILGRFTITYFVKELCSLFSSRVKNSDTSLFFSLRKVL